MRILILFAFIIVFLQLNVFSYASDNLNYPKHNHHEASYQHAWCSAHKGIEEYENKDFTRVDCLTSTNAVEFDFANKWAESIGQALHYQKMTGRKGKVVLILENPTKEMVYFNRVKDLGELYNFDVEFVTTEILCLKADGTCPYPSCKCHKQKSQCK